MPRKVIRINKKRSSLKNSRSYKKNMNYTQQNLNLQLNNIIIYSHRKNRRRFNPTWMPKMPKIAKLKSKFLKMRKLSGNSRNFKAMQKKINVRELVKRKIN